MNDQHHIDAQAQMLMNRLRKRSKHLRKWARRQRTDCFRVYDRDIPELPMVIEVYGTRAAVYDYTDGRSDRQPKVWCPIIADALNIKPENVFWKVRQRQRGNQQYERLGQSERLVCVSEAEFRFYVNLRDYLDTGLFLDHRLTRDQATRDISGLRVLNLFAYTGSFSVYAAGRGAKTVTTVDLSNTYLNWTKKNFELNELPVSHHTFLKANVLSWLDKPPQLRDKYDVIILDPPTFSNSKSMQESFEIERDQLKLFKICTQLIAPNGVLWFSTNKRRFKLDPSLTATWEIEDKTAATTPEDFRKTPHLCWRLAVKETSS